jgi:hypothetical protein
MLPEWLQLGLEDTAPEQARIVLGVLAAAGLFYAFFGYLLFRVALGLTGFLLAAASAVVLAGWLSRGNMPAMGVAALLGGICGAMALLWLYRTGVFLLGCLGAGVAAGMVLSGRPETWAPWAILGIAVLGGTLALLIERPVMTVATAMLGAGLTVYTAVFLFLHEGLEEQVANESVRGAFPWLVLGAWFFLALLGAVTQFALRRRKPA